VTATPQEWADEDDLRAADGRVPGRRGRATRQRLLEQTSEMLRTSSYRDLKVVDIARAAGTSPATFYQYFPDVEAAILALAEEMSQTGSVELSAIVREGSWRGKGAYATSMALADGVLGFWEAHRAVLRVVDLATDEGDERFHKIRVALLNELTNALAEVIDQAAKAGRQPADLDPMAVAGVLVSMLAHVAAHRYGFEFWGIRTDDLRRSMARIVFTTITGQRPPADV
jgi:AcrR family transcriptional regulator